MHHRASWMSLLVAGLLLCGFAGKAWGGIEKMPPDGKAVALITELLKALATENEAARIKAVVPLVHKSLLTADGKDLARNIKDYSFKKASPAAKLYVHPAKIQEVHNGR